MSTNLLLVLLDSVLGFAILLAGSLGYMRVFVLDETICYILMGIGIVMIVAALALMSLKKDLFACAREE